ncbi:FAD-dependent oxidoreductase [Pseudoclavibacter terrae]|uniref:FAD-dependent oxidoreductase n=1 Tax=Pseudoclavibacter terrae TaxID=1530195 RepID=A0A7J5AZV9_9MICO|nr:FAD-dependent oxidoreductase [Pseudoclavibacter terrae]KAB1637126.1 FAD-dependent oxidoreductase [Pseudoclavibacter terrae]
MTDTIVIGAGLAGAAAAWQLAERGHHVTVLERTTPANEHGSSHGSARIFRYAYPEQTYTDLVVRSKAGWDELQRTTGTRLIRPTGALDHGDIRNPSGLATVLEAAGVEHELLSPGEARARWPQFHFETDVLWHPGAGVLDAGSTVDAMLSAASATGRLEVRTSWPVARVERRGAGYRVHSATGEVAEADAIVVAAGGWLPALLGELSLPSAFLDQFPALEVRQEQAYHFPYREAEDAGTDAAPWPTFIFKSRELQTYGLPGGRDADWRGQKVAQFNGGKIIDSALAQDGVVDAANRRALVAYAETFLPGVEPEPYAETTCLFTTTPTEDFVIDRVDNLVVVSACSGHGGKFAPLLGELAADVLTGTGSVPAEFRVTAQAGARA